MPLFEYQCRDCEAVTEFLEKPGAKGPHACGQCGSKRTEKRFSTFSAPSGSAGGGGAPPACDRSCPTGTCPFAKG